MSRLPPPRIVLALAVAPAAVAGLLAVGPALASSTHGAAAAPRVSGRVMIAPLTGPGPRTAALAATAAKTCVTYATRAGWPNNGYYSGDLVTAAAICVAESAGDPSRIRCDPGGKSGDYPTFTCPGGTTSRDRGLWQLNSAIPTAVSDACAFDPVCNADTAYLASGRGTDFSFWSSYDLDAYKVFIDPVQAVVTRLRGGTVTSAVLGECLAQVASKANSKTVIANCGDGSGLQSWSLGAGHLRSGSVCAAVGSAGPNPGIVLRPCARNRLQDWVAYGRDELRNAADRKCLTDPKSSLTAGTQVDVTTCANAKDQTWWLP